jgi:endonuclease G
VYCAEAPEIRCAGPGIDPDYGHRLGYDPEFLGSGPLRVEPPRLSRALELAAARLHSPAPGSCPYELKYHHYSAVVHRSRRLAIFTAVNIEGDRAEGLTRESDRWIRDPRVDRDAQVGAEFYRGTPFDKGHLVRRIDPAWGPDAQVAKVANDDTFHFTNCAPQHKTLNRGLALWRGLEDFLIQRAVSDRRRVTVFTGPVFDRDGDLNPSADPEYAGVGVPRWYWKVAVAARPGGTLGALGFLVSQADLVDRAVSDLRAEEAAVDVATTFQVPVTRIADLTSLDFGPLAAREAPSVAGLGREVASAPTEEIRLMSPEDIRIPWADA